MPGQVHLTEGKARAVLQDLCETFNVPMPRFVWAVGADGGTTAYAGKFKGQREREVAEILIGPNVGGGSEMVLIHEFAHLLRAHRDGLHVDDRHNKHFFWALVDVATHYYGDPSAYPWGTEKGWGGQYKRTWKRAKDRGFTK